MPKPKRHIATLLMLALGVAPTAAAAQNLVSTYIMRPAPGSPAAVEAALRAHSQWREENGDPWSWQLWQVVNGENAGEIHARSLGHSWADFDRYYSSDFARRANDHFNATVAPLLESAASLITEAHPELSMPPAPGEQPMLAEVTVYHLRPGGEQAFIEGTRSFRQAAPSQGWSTDYVIYSARNGGPGPRMIIVGLCPDWACLGGETLTPAQVLTRALGQDEASRLLDRFTNAYSGTTTFIAAYRPDLSVNGRGR